MSVVPSKAIAWFRRRADDVAAVLLSAMFVAFIVQIFMRYVLNWPVGWSTEVCALAWLWGILWGSSFVLAEEEEIRFDILYQNVGTRTRRVFEALSAMAVVALYAISLPATISYIAFMKVERSAYLDIPFDYLFSIYILFACATIVRYSRILWRSVRPGAGRAGAPNEAGRAS
jgi:TRAP-type C4-dicarboxylate transport system permease small subunit